MTNLSLINDMTKEQMIETLGHIFEHGDWIIERIVDRRPFTSSEQLWATLERLVRTELSMEEQRHLLVSHPDLAGRAAETGSLSKNSTAEQKSAGLDALSSEEKASFKKFNDAYKEKFGFPFIICVRENKKEAILKGFEIRLQHDVAVELVTALDQVILISKLRFSDLFSKM